MSASVDGDGDGRPERTKKHSGRVADPENVAVQPLRAHRRVSTTVHPSNSTNTPSSTISTLNDEISESGSRNLKRSAAQAGLSRAGSSVADSLQLDDDDDDDADSEYVPDPSQVENNSDDIQIVERSNTASSSAHEIPERSDKINDVTLHNAATTSQRVGRASKTQDIDPFYEPVVAKTVDGVEKRTRMCKTCKYALSAEVSTLRRHVEAYHLAAYNGWIKKSNLLTKLPKAKKRREDEEKQSKLDPHLVERPVTESSVRYSDAAFLDAAIEWLVNTNQPIQSLNDPSFQKMIDLASRATNGVSIPSGKVTRKAILERCRRTLGELKKTFESDSVSSVNLTCDCWQASNTDAYFAVTAHWVEEKSPNQWILLHCIIGFIRLNNSHNGRRLGKALFLIIERVGIILKTRYITTDNASNNRTMMQELARLIEEATGDVYDYEKYHLRCLAHIINLATQAFLSEHSKAKHFDIHNPEEHIPTNIDGELRDEIGLVRAIAVKARSSPQRKELHLNIQRNAGVSQPRQLKLDMKVRWSSTFEMLARAFQDRKHVDEFVFKLRTAESDANRKEALRALELTEDEWRRVSVVIGLLSFADRSQQAFSSDNYPSMYSALPALEELHKAWSTRQYKDKYIMFQPALTAGVEKIEFYYNKVADNEAYLFSMILNPAYKLNHFRKHWLASDCNAAVEVAEIIYKSRHLSLFGATEVPKSPKKQSRARRYVTEVSDDEDIDINDSQISQSDSSDIYMQGFKKYIDSPTEDLPENLSLVQWWGLNSQRFPVWASLAKEYLSIMSSSVSSERAFSQAGLTITKHRNRLKGDIVEALQFVKCAIRQDLIFKEPQPSMAVEEALEEGVPWESDEVVEGWDAFLAADEEDDSEIVMVDELA